MNWHIRFLAMPVALAILAMATAGQAAAATLLVHGVVHGQIIQGAPDRTPHGVELQVRDTWEGTLAGTGVSHAFGSEPYSEGVHGEATGTRTLNTQDGNLFFLDVDTDASGFPVVTGVLVVSRGTGIYKRATGTLTVTGLIGGGLTEWVYSGTIELRE